MEPRHDGIQEPKHDGMREPKPDGIQEPKPDGMREPKHEGIRISTDAMIALVVTEAENRELAAMPSLREMDAAFRPSPQFQQKMARLLRSAKNRKRARRQLRALRRAAVCVFILITLFSCSMIPFKAVQEAVMATLMEWREQFMSIVYSSDDAKEKRLPETIEVGYVPEGFVLQEPTQHTDRIYFAEYADGAGYFNVRIIGIEYQPQIRVDNEYATVYSIRINGRDAVWGVSDSGVNTLTWSEEQFVYQISGTVDLKTLIRIAESIKM